MTFLSSKTPAGVLALILRVALGAIFVYAAWIKLREPWALFAMAIDSYQVLPVWAVEVVARALPWFELLLGVLLIAGLWRHVSDRTPGPCSPWRSTLTRFCLYGRWKWWRAHCRGSSCCWVFC